MPDTNKYKSTSKRYDDSQQTSKKVLEDSMFRVSDKIKSEYDMWYWIFQEIANLRLEVSRLGILVRINNRDSPNYIEPYHSHIYSLLLPVSVVIPDKIWKKIYAYWLSIKTDINNFHRQRASVTNKKIPFELIRKLDNLYRAALLTAQKAGLGIKVTYEEDIDAAIERSITGN